MIFEVSNLKLGYNGDVVIFVEEFRISDGEIAMIYGENGSGKSTLLEGFAGLKKPLSGEILIDGDKINAKKKDRIGFLPQGNPLIGELSIRDNIKLLVNENSLKDAFEMLENFGVNDEFSKKVSDLSGGTKRKVFLSAIMAEDYDIYILDEPIASLDVESANYFFEIVYKKLNDGKIIIMTNHQGEPMKLVSKKFEIAERKLLKIGDENENEH